MSPTRIVKAMPRVPGMDQTEIDEFLARNTLLLRLGSIDHEGHPNIHPVWYHHMTGKIYLMSNNNDRKIRNLARNSTVYFSIDTETRPYKGVKGKGTAVLVKDPKLLLSVAEKIVVKYLGNIETGYGKRMIDDVKGGKEALVEITPRYFAVWDYGKRAT